MSQPIIETIREVVGLPLIVSPNYNQMTIALHKWGGIAHKHHLQANHVEQHKNYLFKVAEAKVLKRAPLKDEKYFSELQMGIEKEIRALIK